MQQGVGKLAKKRVSGRDCQSAVFIHTFVVCICMGNWGLYLPTPRPASLERKSSKLIFGLISALEDSSQARNEALA